MDLASDILATILAILGSTWYSMVAHEWSHYLAGWAAGVPVRRIRVRMRPSPPHVSLYNGYEWLSPDKAGYVETFISHQPRIGWAWFYIAAGMIGELLAVLATATLLATLGLTVMALILTGTSAVTLLVYLFSDAVLTRSRGRPTGDFSSMWQITKLGTAAITVVVMVLYVIAILTIGR